MSVYRCCCDASQEGKCLAFNFQIYCLVHDFRYSDLSYKENMEHFPITRTGNRNTVFSMLTYVYKINCKSKLRLLRKSKYICWNWFSKFLAFNYLKCFVKTASLETRAEHVGSRRCLQAALPNLGKPNSGPKLAVVARESCPHPGTHLRCSGQGRSCPLGKSKPTARSEDCHLLRWVCISCFCEEGTELMKFTTGYMYYKNTLSSPTWRYRETFESLWCY